MASFLDDTLELTGRHQVAKFLKKGAFSMRPALTILAIVCTLSTGTVFAGRVNGLSSGVRGIQLTSEQSKVFPRFIRERVSEMKPFKDSIGGVGVLAQGKDGTFYFRVSENGNLEFSGFSSNVRFRTEPSYGTVQNGSDRYRISVEEYINTLRANGVRTSSTDYRHLPESVQMVRPAPEQNGFLQLRIDSYGKLRLSISKIEQSTHSTSEMVVREIDSIGIHSEPGFTPVVAQIEAHPENGFIFTVVEDSGSGHFVSVKTSTVKVRYVNGQAQLSAPILRSSEEQLRTLVRANLPVKRSDGPSLSEGLFGE